MTFCKRPTKPAPDFAQLEDRVMLSAAPATLAAVDTSFDGQVDSLTPSTDYVLHVQAPAPAGDDASYAGSETDEAAANRRLDDPHTFRFESSAETDGLRYELVVIDEAAADYQQLVDDLLTQQSDARQFEIVVLDSDRDGIEQISEILADYDQLDALHIVSHSSEGAVRLGNSWLNLENVGGYAGQLVGWRDALAADADLMFYGCDLAANEDGKLLLESIGTLCDCDVAASVDNTGHSILGGDWRLEYLTGSIEASVAFSTDLQQNWGHLLSIDPVISLPSANINYTENDPATVVDAAATVSDPDSTDFDTGTLTVDFTANGTVNDRLEIRDQGSGVGNISVSGSNVRYDFGSGPVVIGTLAGGTSGSDPLVITLNANSDDPSVEALMQNITYRNVSENPSTLSRTVRFVLTDGDDGTSDPEAKTINVAAINDAPVVGVPGAPLAATEQTPLAIHSTGFTVSDVDEAGAGAIATLSVAEGTITVVNGDSGVMILIGNGTGSVTLSGTIAQLDNLLTGAGTGTITYLNSSDTPSASATFTVTVNDSGNTGNDPGTSGGPADEEGTNNVTINITAINDAPVVGAPGGPLATTENIGLVIHGTGFTVSDVDEAGAGATATLSATEGTITVVVGDSGVTITGGNGTGTVTLTGTIAQIDDLLTAAGTGTITYSTTEGPSASATFTVTVNDSGNTGADPGTSGGPADEEGTNNVTINITAINDAPVVGAPGGPLAATEQVGLALHGTGFTVSDVDEAGAGATATLSVTEGTITVVEGDSGVTITGGNGTGTVTVSGTIAQLDNLLTGAGTGTITYLNSSDTPSASATFTVTVNDSGNTGNDPGTSGGPADEEDTNNVTINITAINDAPVVGAPGGPLAATENIGLAIQGTGFTVSDVDEAGAGATATLSVTEGTITVVEGDSGVTITGGNGTGTVTLTGTIAQIDDLLTAAGTGTITYNTTEAPSAAATFTVTVNDSGNTGADPGTSGGPADEEGTNNVTINITAINDAPVVGAPGGPLAATEQVGLALQGTGFTVSDADEAGAGAMATLSVTEGTITVVEGDSGVTITGGNGTGTVTVSGTIAQLDNLLTAAGTGTITYLNSSDTPSASATFTVTVNDSGNTGADPGTSGGPADEEDTNNVTINITAINDAPVVGAPGGPLAANEQVGLVIHGTGFTVSDVDEAGAGATATLSVTEGTITVVEGDSSVTITGGNGTGTVTVSGTIAQLDNLLTGAGTGTITYLNSSDTPSASATFTVTVNDSGNTGADPGTSGGPADEEDTNNVTINIGAINDAPVVGAPGGPLAATENIGLAIQGTGFTVSDVDEAGAGATATLSATEGTITVVEGDSGVTITGGNGTGTVTLSGTIAQLDNLLTAAGTGTITYSTTEGPSASATFTVTVNDSGNTGADPGTSGGPADEEGTNNVTINITAINDAPVVGAPGGPLAATEQVGLVIHGTGFTVSDVDEAGAGATATLSVTEGTVTVVEGDSGVTITGGNGTGTVTVSGTIAQLDNLLTAASTGTITYLNSSDTPSASATFTVTVNDSGNTGNDPGTSGGPADEEGTNNVTINITAINDAPVVGAPGGPLAATENIGLAIHGTGFTVSDVDEAGAGATATLSVTEGTITVVEGDSGVTITGGNGTGTVTLTGTIAQIDDLLTAAGTGTITYLDSSDTPSASATFTVTVNDSGNTGADPGTSGGPADEEDTNNVTINITAINDAPVVGAPGGPLAATEQVGLALHGTGFTVSDVDEAGAGATATLSVTEGTITVAEGDSGVTITGGNGTGTVTVSGTIAQLDNLLTGAGTGTITYLNSSDTPSASATFTVTVNDSGNTGADPGTSGGPADEEGTNNVTINITAINDAPVVGAPGGPLAATENIGLAIQGTGFTVSDVDEAGAGATATLSATEGTITVVEGDSGVTITGGNGTGTVTLSGTIAQLDNLLTAAGTGTITYSTTESPSVSATFTVTVNDSGNTGADPGTSGGPADEEGTNNVTINITAINDAPVVGAPGGPLAATEQVGLALHGTGFTVSDVDEAGAGATATLSVTEGTITVVEGDSSVTITGGNGTGTVTVSGTIAQLDNLLTGAGTGTITYLNSSDTPGASANFTVTVNDSGNTGNDPGTSGGPADEEGTNNVTINITAINDAPVVGAPGGPLAATENIGLAIHGTGFTVSDVDEAGAGATATLSATEGMITVVEGDSGVTITGGNGTGTVTLTGTIAQIDDLLTAAGTGTITYNTTEGPSASATFTVTVNDSGNTGADPGTSGGPADEEGTNNVTINITAINDAPVVGAPGGPLAATENIGLAIHGTGFTVSDADEAGAGATATLSVTEGTISVVEGDSGVTATGGNGTATVTVSGTIAQLNNLFTAAGTGTITYLNSSDTPSASATFTVTVNDSGNTGADPGTSGGPADEEGTNNVTINITAINDAPVVGAPGGPLAATENIGLAIHGTGFTVSDVDEAGAGATATLSATEGMITVVEGDSGVTITGGNGTGTVTLAGTIAQIDDLLTAAGTGTITYNTTEGPSVTATFTVTVNDSGNTGADPGTSGGPADEEGTNNVTINITAINDAPVVGAPGGPLATTENIGLAIHGTGFTVSDVDEAGAGATATLSVTEGTITVVEGDSGVTITGGNGTGTVTLTGTIAQIDDLLTAAGTGTITYNTTEAPSATATFTVTVNDSGNTGADPGTSGGPADEEDTNNVTINIGAINDAPVVGAPGGPLAATEQVGLALHGTGFTVSDADEAGAGATATLSVTEGTITVVEGDSGVTITGGNGTGAVTLTGTIAQIDDLLTAAGTGTITYLNSSDTPSASATFTVTVNDSGNTGNDPGTSGGPADEEGTNNVTINITAINDAPMVGAPGGPLAATENIDLAIQGTGFTVSDVDEAGAGATATLSVTEGTITVVEGDSGVTITGGNGTGTVTLTGTIAQIDDLLTAAGTGTITYSTTEAPSASATFTVTVNDSGNTGADPGTTGGPADEEDTNNVTINITAMNEAPVVGAPGGPLAATEQVGLALHGTGFTVSDVDEAGAGATATLSVTEGTVTVVEGDSGVTITGGNGTGTVTLSGTIAQLDNLLTAAGTGTITYLNSSDTPSASATFTVTVNDQGNTGSDPGISGGPADEEGTNNVTINIGAINDAPVVGAPGGPLATTENIGLAIHGTGFTVSDVDEAGAGATATLSVSEGTITVVEGDSGVTITGGNGTGTVTLTGTIAQIDDLLTAAGTGTITYNTTEAPSATATFTVTVNDSGNTGADPGTSGGPADEEGTNNVTINITAINDAPVVGAPGGPLAATENIGLAIHGTGFTVSDADEAGAGATATLSVTEGTITVVEGDSGVTITGGNGTGTVTLTGTIAQIDGLLTATGTGTITYLNSSDTPSASATFTVTVNDSGNTGADPGTSGGPADEEDTNNVTINITAINDAPVVGAPGGPLAATEQVGLVIHGTGFTVSDVDEAGAGATATLSVTEGTITVVEGDSGVTITGGNGTGTVTVSGTIAQLDNLLTAAGTGTITYLNSSDTPGASATFTVTVNDSGNTGADPGTSGGPADEEGTNNVTINIAAINDAPVVGAPGGPLATTENIGLAIQGTGFTVSDVDEAGAGATATLSVTEGTITVVEGDSGVTITGGNGTGTVTLTGTIAQIDDLLTAAGTGTITYATTEAPSATATFTVTVNDSGNTGADPGTSGGPADEEDTNNVTINITAINDAPVIGAPGGPLAATEQVGLALHGTGFTVSDVDEAGAGATATLSVTEGTITVVEGDSGVTITGGNGTGTVTVSGTIAQLDNLLTGAGTGTITYLNSSDTPSASATFTVTVNDSGNTGSDPGISGGPADEEGTNNVTINITAINDAPVVGAPGGPLAATENIGLAIHGTGFTVSDVDEAGAGATATLSVTEGTITVVEGDSGVTITGGNGTGTVTLTGTIAQIDDLLTAAGTGTITYNTTEGPSASATFTVTVNDSGNTGADPGSSGGPADEEGTNNVTINITAINDAPVVGAPGGPLAATENIGLAIHGTGFTVSDVDESGAGATATLSVTEGTITVVEGDSGVTITGGNGTGTVTLTGTIAQIDDLLTAAGTSTITYNTTEAPSATATFTVTVNDSGNTGADPGTSGGPADEEDTNNVTINIGAINDAPVVGAPGGPLAATEQVGLVIHGTGFTVSDVDEAGAGATATLSVTEGTITVAEGDSGVTITGGNGTGSVTLSGTIAQIDDLLTAAGTGTITYLNSSDTPSVSATFTVTVNDSGNTGADPGTSGGPADEEGTNNVTINITAVNDAPVVGAPGGPLAATENIDLAIEGTGFTVSDVDEAGAGATATLSVTEGTITVVEGDSGVTITGGNGTGTVTVSGTVAQLDHLLTAAGTGTITYLNSSDTPSASATFTVTVNDQGNTGSDPGISGGPADEEGTNNVTINITAINDAPVVGAPGGPLATTENIGLAIHGTGFTVSDVDEAGAGATATLSATEGTITVVEGDSGVTITGGNGTGTVTLTGTIAQIDDLLTAAGTGTITYNTIEAPSATATFTVTVNDSGNTGADPGTSGGPADEEGTNNVTINITAINDAPVVGAPGGSLAATEQVGLALHGTGFTVSDIDEAGAGATATLSVTEGTITVAEGDSGVTITGGNGTGTVTVSGAIAQLDNLLTGAGTGTITYLNSSDTPSASATFTVTVNDSGNTGADPGSSGGPADEEGTNNVTINISAINDAPVVGAPGGPLAATENIGLAIHGTGFTVSDVDEAGAGATATLSVTEGTITVVEGDSGVTITGGNGTGTVTVSGTIAQLDNLLTAAGTGTITYLNSSDTPSASATFTVTVNDSGNTGADPGTSGGPADEEGTNNVTINITAINDAPVVGAPGGPLAATENIGLAIHGTGFTVSDVDEAGAGATATLSVTEGTITVVEGDSGVTITGGNGTGTVTLTGTIAQIDDLLTAAGTGTITYNTTQAPSATATFTVTVNDSGNTGADPGTTGGPADEEGTNNVTINIGAINDAPVVGAPGGPLAATEQVGLALHGTGFTVSDADEAGAGATATLSVTEGTITVVEGDSGVTITGGNGTGTVTVSGAIAQLDNLLTGAGTGTITYLNSSDTPSASATFTVTVNDSGNTGADPGTSGGPADEEDTNNVTINIGAINDAPVVGAPGGPLAVDEQVGLAIHGTGFTVSDVDEAGAGATATLSVTEGTITIVEGDSGVTITGGNGTGTVTLTGTIAQIDDLLTATGTGTITYLNSSDTPSASATFTVTVNDSGNIGADPGTSGGPADEEGTNNVTIIITSMNEAPVVGAPGGPLAAIEQVGLALHGTGFTVSDVDEAGAGAIASLSVNEGSITVVEGDSGVTILVGNGSGSVTLSGTIAQLDNLLTGAGTGTITYLNSSDAPSASATFTVTVNDSGNTGNDPGISGGPADEEGTNNVTINITAINDAPVVGAPGGPLAATEQVGLIIHGTGFTVSDVDEAGAGAIATLSVTEGTITVVEGDSSVTLTGGNGTGTVTLTGTIAQIDNLLTAAGTGTITYNAIEAPSASATFTVTVNDSGNTGADPGTSGGPADEEDTNNVTINITAINDAPVVGAPGGPLAATEQVGLAVHGTGFTVSDVDEAGAGATATLSVTEGTITVVEGDSGVTITGGNGTGTVTVSGTIVQLDNLLTAAGTGTITYLNSSDTPSASATFTVTVNDQGNTGSDPGISGGPADEEGTNNVTINITAINDAPVVGAPGGPLAATEQVGLAIHGTGFTVSDVDEAGAGAIATLSVTEGTITVVEGDSSVTLTGGNGTGTVTLTGTIAQIDDLLTATGTGTITYLDSSDTPSPSATFTVTVNDSGNTGADPGTTGGPADEEGTNNVTINITAINDAPVVGAPGGPLAATENIGLAIQGTGFTVSDVDEAAAGATATLSVTEGTITVVEGDSGVTITGGNGTGTVTVSGTIAQLDNLLTAAGTGTITYLNSSDTPSASATFTVTVNDSGNTGADPGTSGGPADEEDTNNVTINITAINDAPVVGAPGGPLAATEQVGLVIHGTGFTVSDVDEAGAGATATLSVTEGTITVVEGDSGVTITGGNGTGTVTVSGTIAQLDNLLTAAGTGTITYLNSSDTPSASATFTVTVNDQGNTGSDPGISGGPADEEGTNNVTINITAINDAPVVGAPGGPLAATENIGLAIHGTGFTVSDVDEAAAGATATLSVTEGTISVVAGDSGVTITGGNGTGTVTLTGTIAQIDDLLTAAGTGTITYNAIEAPSASATFTVTVNDSGNTGADPGTSGGPADEEGTNNVTINIGAINDAPVVGAPGGPLAATEQVGLVIHGTGFTVSDIDEAGAGATATLSVTEGTITVVEGDSGVTITGGNGTGSVTLSGTIAQLDNLLTAAGTGTITYLNSSDTPSASATFTVTVNDQGNTGSDPGISGGPADEEGTNNVTINITAINDAPVVGAPGGSLAATEQVGLVIHGTGFTVSDVDEASSGAIATLSVTEGAITVVEGDSGVTITGGNGTGSVTLSGTIAQLNNLLTAAGTGTITYLNSSDTPSASATFTVTVNDSGNTGADPGTSGGPADEEGTNNVTINITAINDAPVVGAPGGSLAATEQVDLVIHGTGFTVSDVDEAGSGAIATLSVTEGAITVVEGDSGVTITGGNGTGSVTLSGTIAQIDDLLTAAGTGTITYLNSSDTPSVSATFTVTVNDSGNTGADPGTSGGPADEEGTNNVTINIGAINDAPVVGAPGGPLAATEQVGLAIHGTGFTVSDIDEAGAGATATLSVTEGTITVAEGDSGVTVTGGNGTATVTVSGTIVQLDNLLTAAGTGTITYLNSSDTPSASATFTVTVNDQGNTGSDPGISGGPADEEGTNNVTINITAINDAPVITSDGGGPTASVTVSENTTTVTTVMSTDVDGGIPAYGIFGGGDAGLFSIDSASGVLTFDVAPDFESPGDTDLDNVYEVTVQVTDGHGGSDAQAISVTVTDVNEFPVPLDDTFTVSETAANGTLVGIVTASDVDAGQTLSYAITAGDPTNVFAINPASGEITVADSSQLDASASPSYALTVEVTDDGAPPRTSAATITILVTNVNEPPVVNDQSFSIVENATDGAPVGTVIFNDPDVFDTHFFLITGGSGATAFAVNAATGEITVVDSSQLDYETTTTFTLDVVVTDDGMPNRSDSATITVNLNPLNDNVPVGMTESATVIFEESVSVLDSENSSVLDNDRDADVPADTLTTILHSGPSHAATFTLNPDGTFLYVHDGSDLEIDSFTYRISDGTNTSDPVTVTINILPLDVPDDSPIDNDPPRDDPPDKKPPDDDPSDDEPPAEVLPPGKVPTPPNRPRPRHPTQHDPSEERREQLGPSVRIPIDGPSEVSGQEGVILFNTGSDHLSVEFRHPVEVLSDTASDLVAFVNPQLLFEKLNDFQDGLKQNDQATKLTIGSVAIASLGVTAGYMFWTVKGGYLLASVLSNMPAWRFIDPLPIYDAVAGRYWEDEKEKEKVRIS